MARTRLSFDDDDFFDDDESNYDYEENRRLKKAKMRRQTEMRRRMEDKLERRRLSDQLGLLIGEEFDFDSSSARVSAR